MDLPLMIVPPLIQPILKSQDTGDIISEGETVIIQGEFLAGIAYGFLACKAFAMCIRC